MRFLILTLSLLTSSAFAGQPANPNPPAVTAAAQTLTVTKTMSPDGTVTITQPVTPTAPFNGPLWRTSFTLETPEGCPGLQISGFQQVGAQTALSLQAGAAGQLDACGRLMTAQANAQATITLAGAGAQAASAGADYVMVDASRQRVVTANGTAAMWAAASNGGQTYPTGLMPGGTFNYGASSSYQLLGSGLGQQTPGGMIVLPPATTPASKPAARPATAAATVPSNTQAAAAVLDAASKK